VDHVAPGDDEPAVGVEGLPPTPRRFEITVVTAPSGARRCTPPPMMSLKKSAPSASTRGASGKT
jgi:hypothetical protein